MKGKALGIAVLFQFAMILAFLFYNQYLNVSLEERILDTMPMRVYSNEQQIYINYGISEIQISKLKRVDFDYKKERPKIVYLKLSDTKPAEVTEVTIKKPTGVFVKANFAGAEENRIHVYFKGRSFENNGKLPVSETDYIYHVRAGIDRAGNIHIKEIYK